MSRLKDWLGERFPMPAVTGFLRSQARKPLPPHVTWYHTLGSLSLFLLVNQIVTGILLMVYYRPTTDQAFASVRYISGEVHFGWLIRGLHSWGSTLMILMVVLHLCRTFFGGAFKKPRELTWIVGVALLALTLTFGFTGYLLPWNQLSYWATTVGTEIAGSIPLVGETWKRLLLGGDSVAQETLLRFYVFHVVILPWVTVALVAFHLVLVRTQGLSTLNAVGSDPPPPTGWRPFYPHHVLKELVVWSIFLAVMFALVVLWPPEVGERADPLTTPEGIKPEWYFLPSYQLLKYFPKLLGLFVVALPLFLVLFWPFIDRTPERRFGRRPVSVTIGLVALVATVVLGVLGYLSDSTVSLFGSDWHFDHYGIPKRVP